MAQDKEIYQYLRNKDNRKIGVALAVADDNAYAIGVSVVNVNGGDVFDAYQGIEMARGRANKLLKKWPQGDAKNTTTLEVPAKVHEDIKEFANRCSHYFKDKTSVVGKVEANTITMNFDKSVQELTALFDKNYKGKTGVSLKEEALQLKKIGQALEVVGTTQDKNNMTKVLKT